MNKPYGPDNPHPLSGMKTELLWEGKYDEYGNRRAIDLVGAAMPLQKIETIDEPRARAEAQGTLFEPAKSHADEFRNRLIWGENKLVMASLLSELKGKIDLIYIDPPFDVGADFTVEVSIGDSSEKATKDQSILEMVAYRDTWGKGTDSYIHTMYERMILMKDLLSENGYLFVHLAPTVADQIRIVGEEIFGKSNFRNEIIVHRPITKNLQRQFETIESLPQGHDVILMFSKNHKSRFRNLLIPYDSKNPEGYWHRFWSGADRPTMRYELLGETPSSGQWKWQKVRAEEAVRNYERFQRESAGRTLVQYWKDTGRTLEFIRHSSTGTVENWFPPSEDKIGDTVWDDIKAYENIKDFPTQKHREILGRIIEWVTNEGSLVADLFCGGGTTGVVAETLGRRWIMCDLGRLAIHTSRKRLIDVQRKLHDEGRHYRAFDVYNLGRYERQWWQSAHLNGAEEEHRRVVLEFFRAEVLSTSPSPLIHGRKGTGLCHVSAIDTIFTRTEATEVARSAVAAGAREVWCLAWEFEMDIRLHTAALERETGVTLKPVQIPREIMERNRIAPPPFLEVALLEAEPVVRSKDGRRIVDIKLTRFMPSLVEVPSKELEALRDRAIKSGFDFIDFWAVDFDWHPGKPFAHNWQDYRTRKDRSLKTVSDAAFAYDKPGPHTACLKVVDVFGCDTSISVEVIL